MTEFAINLLTNNLAKPEEEIMKGVKWGRCDKLFTPAYWKMQYHFHEEEFSRDFYKMGENIIHEICACILGGFGMRSELGLIAFERLRDLKLLTPKVSHASLLENLSAPFNLEGRYIKYRFPNQKAKYLFQFLNRDDLNEIPQNEDLKLREWLLTVNGIGMKTASWITRNWLCSDRVAILDIHIYRAGLIAGFFPKNLSIEKDYKVLEEKYLEFSNALDVSAANLDSLIWLQFKMANDLALSILKIKN